MTDWVDVNNELPESRTLVYIYVIYTKNPYDDVTERISIGTYQEGIGMIGWTFIMPMTIM